MEKACTIATIQCILPQNTAQAKLVSILPDKNELNEGTVQWGQDFGDDERRKEWHERKMTSKLV